MRRLKAKGVFCLEGDWDGDLRSKTSVEPVLDLLSSSLDPSVPYIRRDVGTVAEFEHYVSKWTLKRYAAYPILYLGFHGNPGILYVGDGRGEPRRLAWLGEKLAGRCKGRVVHFGSCGTMDVHGRELNHFLKVTGALAVCGYKQPIEWMLSAAFEIILLGSFQKSAFTAKGMSSVHNRVIQEAAGLARHLQFRMVVAGR